jgi:RNA polymerase sigma-70 factor (ECF subfamily)
MGLGQLSDESLLAEFRATGEPGQLDELFRRHYPRVAWWCLRLTGDREKAADLAQDVFTKAFRHLDSYQGDAKFSTWLYSIARNHCWSELRSRAVRPEDSGEAPLKDLVDGHPDPLSSCEHNEAAALLRQWIEECLDEMEKRVFALYYDDELSLGAITRLLGLENLSGAKGYLVSGKRKLERAARSARARPQDAAR